MPPTETNLKFLRRFFYPLPFPEFSELMSDSLRRIFSFLKYARSIKVVNDYSKSYYFIEKHTQHLLLQEVEHEAISRLDGARFK